MVPAPPPHFHKGRLTKTKGATMKHNMVTLYYPVKDGAEVGDGNVGYYINTLLHKGIKKILIVNAPQPHSDHQHEAVLVPQEPPYTAIQGNVGSS